MVETAPANPSFKHRMFSASISAPRGEARKKAAGSYPRVSTTGLVACRSAVAHPLRPSTVCGRAWPTLRSLRPARPYFFSPPAGDRVLRVLSEDELMEAPFPSTQVVAVTVCAQKSAGHGDVPEDSRCRAYKLSVSRPAHLRLAPRAATLAQSGEGGDAAPSLRMPNWRLHSRGVSKSELALLSVSALAADKRRRRGKGFSSRSRKKRVLSAGTVPALPARVVDADSAVNACDPVFVLAGRVSGRPAESSAFIAVPAVPKASVNPFRS
ncbi:hypothetical protein HPB50_003208 [Hyalomma asiaticum]|uniref:Uncharacterized protein n=1 Tax=Hyalomma asiaticum TaxID=266040 RepID=A0ACB7TBQ9_HYAAI|nr:hypothetical protein HPB50_003208 [Hyalomma asiaticum]